MKQLCTFLLSIFFTITGFSQAPQKFSYQSVIRNAGNQLVVNQQVGIKISILQGSANGSAVYSESHSPLTNANGLATLEIGGGTVLSGNFANINWSSGPYFVKTETDLNGGINYTIISTQQLLSVPYALYSNDVSSSVSVAGDTLFIGSQSYIIPGISSANNGGGQTGITAHTCGATNVHNPAKTYGTMTDQQGNVYRTIAIGNQEWMAENLKTSIYRNGDAIANVTENPQWTSLTTGAWCYYNNDSQYDCPYGKLYNWYAVNDPRNVCPIGWHVPSDDEWNTFINYLDPNSGGGTNPTNVAGGKMKSTGIQYWNSPNQGANNECGFSGLPGGQRNVLGAFDQIANYGYWWSSTFDADIGLAWPREINKYDSTIFRDGNGANTAFSLRCMRD